MRGQNVFQGKWETVHLLVQAKNIPTVQHTNTQPTLPIRGSYRPLRIAKLSTPGSEGQRAESCIDSRGVMGTAASALTSEVAVGVQGKLR